MIDEAEDFMERYKKPVTWTVLILLLLGGTYIAYKNKWFRSAPKVCQESKVVGFLSQVCDSTSGKYECRPGCRKLSNDAQVCWVSLSNGQRVEITDAQIGDGVTQCPGSPAYISNPLPKTMSPAPSANKSPSPSVSP